jgi:restriction endonuclease S subunit
MTKVEDWGRSKLSSIADIGWGDLSVTKKSYVESGYTAFSATGADGFLPYFDYDESGIVVSAIGANCGKIWRAHGKWSCIKNTMRIILKDSPVTLDYLFYFLSDPNAFPKRGSGQPFISKEDARDIEISYPPLLEQHKIVEILEDHLSRLDAALADVKQAKVKAAQFRRSLLQAAFTGNLGSDGTRFITDLPNGWRIAPLGQFIEPRKQKDIPSNFPSLPYIGMENVLRDVGVIDSYGNSKDYRSLAPKVFPGDVLYGRLRPYLNKVVIAKGEAFASGEFIILPPNEYVLGRFLQLRLLSQDFVQFTATLDTGDRPRVSWNQISKFEVLLPPLPEQHKIVEILEGHLSRLDASIALADAMEKQSAGLRRSLLQAAFTGQLTKEVASV